MSIDVSVKIQKKCISVNEAELYIKEFFSVNENLNRKSLGQITVFSSFYKENQVILYFTEKDSQIYESRLIKDEFKYSQSLLFDIEKDDISIEDFTIIIRFCKYLKSKIDSDILITSDVHDEICLMKNNEIVFSDSARELKESYYEI